jgi:hypothetical protein
LDLVELFGNLKTHGGSNGDSTDISESEVEKHAESVLSQDLGSNYDLN